MNKEQYHIGIFSFTPNPPPDLFLKSLALDSFDQKDFQKSQKYWKNSIVMYVWLGQIQHLINHHLWGIIPLELFFLIVFFFITLMAILVNAMIV